MVKLNKPERSKYVKKHVFPNLTLDTNPKSKKTLKLKKRGLNQREMLSSCVLWPTNRSKGKIEKTEDPSPEKEQGQRQRRSFFRVCDKKTED